ncbi:Hypp5118 [Branchiostoma lanceolatum]|uniref:Hypp5118 protein n=1 Tax=Branchiostoma lanceolatum TaxID=7740 RepID=A0A8K0ADM1_BRALA|nr:Hypp5118 [Branchiostoma lanceolatum]
MEPPPSYLQNYNLSSLLTGGVEDPPALRNDVRRQWAGCVSFMGVLLLTGGIFVLKENFSAVGGKTMIAIGLLAILGATGVNCCLSMAQWKGEEDVRGREMGQGQLATASPASLAPASSRAEMTGSSQRCLSGTELAGQPPVPLFLSDEPPQYDDRPGGPPPKYPGTEDFHDQAQSFSSTSNSSVVPNDLPPPPSYEDVVRATQARQTSL